MPDQNNRSKVEVFKQDSQYLSGEIGPELTDGNDFFGAGSIQLLKHHGIYQQDNRDERGKKTETGKSGKAFSFMVRTKIPGGRLTSPQLLAEIDLCDEIGNATLRITTRQGLQLHGILKENLKPAIARINQVQLSTLAACGDVERNVMCTPVPFKSDPVIQTMQKLADDLAEHLCPRTNSYHEIWLTDPETGEKEKVPTNGENVEPIYGKTYLPRKFKTGIGLPGDNSVDVYSQDLGFLAICENSKIIGYNVLVGGGFGVTPSAEKTYPGIAQPMAFIVPEQALEVSEAIVKVQRDFGNRQDRKVARLRYTIADMGGVAAFKTKVEEYLGGTSLEPPRPVIVTGHYDGMGWAEQGDGLWFYGLNVENGRIKDDEQMQLKQALRDICKELAPEIRLTPHQSIIFCNIAASDKQKLIDILNRHHVPLTESITTTRRWSMACPALPTCGLSITESERALPGMIDQLEQQLAAMGLQDEVFTTRMTGCPNGCARPYNSDIGLVGRAKGKYTVFVGGRVEGDRLNFIYKDMVPAEEVVAELVTLFAYFKTDRRPNESFGDFCTRKGKDDLLAFADKQTSA